MKCQNCKVNIVLTLVKRTQYSTREYYKCSSCQAEHIRTQFNIIADSTHLTLDPSYNFLSVGKQPIKANDEKNFALKPLDTY